MTIIGDIFQAIIMENMEELRRLLSANQKVDLGLPFRGTTALSFAVYRAHLPSLCILLDSGAPIDKKSMDHLHRVETPIISSIRLGYNNIFFKLLQSGAKLDITDFYNQTPLWFAVKEQRVSFVKILLKNGAPITFDSASESPLNLVAPYIYYKVRRELAIEMISAGLEVNLRDLRQKTPLMWAIHHFDFPLFCLLLEAGAKLLVDSEEEGVRFPKKWEEDSKIWQRVQEEMNIPPPLSRQVRKVIRDHLRKVKNRDLRPLIEDLPLPQILKSFMLLDDAIKMASEKKEE